MMQTAEDTGTDADKDTADLAPDDQGDADGNPLAAGAEGNRRPARSRTERDRLVLENLPLVPWTINRLNLRRRRDHDDLLQEGRVGLIRAAEAWQADRGVKFASYAFWCIRQTVLIYIHRRSGVITLPTNLRGDPWRAANARTHTKPLPAGDLAGLAVREERDAEADGAELAAALEKALAWLPPRRADVLRRRFFAGQTLTEVGEAHGVGRERVRQIERRALADLAKRWPRLAELLAG